MMYIDQAPLGGNLVNIIKKSASFNNTAATPTQSVSSASLAKEINCEENCDHSKTKVEINGIENNIPNGNHQDYYNQKNSLEIKNNINSTIQKTQNGNKEKDTEEEEEYEILEIETETEETPENNAIDEQRENNLNDFKIEVLHQPTTQKTKQEITSTTNKRSRAAYETEDNNCKEFVINFNTVHKTNEQQARKFNKKPSRPIPAAIPISECVQKQKRLLNGFVSRPPSVTYERRDQEIENNSNIYNYIESDIADGDFVPQDGQMGIDILGGLRNLFNWKSKNGNVNPEIIAAGAKRKRGFGNYQPEIITAPHHIKYRKVENNFPKFITTTLDDDDVDNFPTFRNLPSTSNRQRLAAQVPELLYTLPNSIEMTQKGGNHPTSQRRSWFAIPQKKMVRNNVYADYEYSDEDDDEDDPQKRLQQTLGIVTPVVRNIPIQIEPRRQPLIASPYETAKFVHPLRPPTYADILKQQTTSFSNANAGYILGARTSSSNNSSGDGASTSRFCGLDGTSRISTKTLGGSILKQEREKADHEKYKQLLQRVVPRSYQQRNTVFPNSRTQSRNTLRSLTSTSNSKNKTTPFAGKLKLPQSSHRAPLSSTVNIEDDDDNDVDDNGSSSDEVTVTGIAHLNSKTIKNSKKRETLAPISTVIIDDDLNGEEISEIIDLSEDEDAKNGGEKPKRKTANNIEVIDLDAKENKFIDLPYVEPVNSFREMLHTMPNFESNWLQSFNNKWEQRLKVRNAEVNETWKISEKLEAERRAAELDLQTRLRDFRIVDPELVAVDDFEKPEEVPEFPPLTEERQARIKSAICGPPDQVLIEKFNLRITRRDIHTLLGLNWLNDEVINFYMNMITERSERKHESHGYPKAYAMNTFFLQRLLQSGHGGVKRWTRKVNIFEKEVIPVPVHVGGVHWCMAIIHLKKRWIRYYDSMGAPNPNALKALEQYLKDESLDKRNQPFDTSNFTIESVRDVPRQQNGSDCGVFSCMFAEYLSRNKDITFSQQNMEYFRHKMILEIVQGELLL